MKIVDPGTYTLIQDYPGRLGSNRWRVGIPQSGPMDDYSFRIANKLVGNEESAAALEITIGGPTIVFSDNTLVAVTGAPIQVELDGHHVDCWRSFMVRKGQTLKLSHLHGEGVRSYLAVAGTIHFLPHLLIIKVALMSLTILEVNPRFLLVNLEELPMYTISLLLYFNLLGISLKNQ